jgi:glutamate synthase (NADPH) large chain
MTGGTVAVLGKTGRNFAAGMSGGVAYVYDEVGHFARRCNTSMVALDKVLARDDQDVATYHKGQADESLLKALIEDHHRWTGSLRARQILDNWAESRARFIKVFPHEYQRALKQMNATATASATIAKAKAVAVSAK